MTNSVQWFVERVLSASWMKYADVVALHELVSGEIEQIEIDAKESHAEKIQSALGCDYALAEKAIAAAGKGQEELLYELVTAGVIVKRASGLTLMAEDIPLRHLNWLTVKHARCVENLKLSGLLKA